MTDAEKIEARVSFPLELNMLPYTTRQKSKKLSRYLYELESAIVHKGKIDSGHYVSFCRQGDQVRHGAAFEEVRI